MTNRNPQVSIDHVLVAVTDLAESAQRFEAAYGLTALVGGRHPRVGTANMIVPLRSEYLELIAVVDVEEAAQAPSSKRITRAVAEGRTFATWAARTDHLDAVRERVQAARLQVPAVFAGSRERPDGVTLRWRTQFLVPPGEPSVLPFVIEWHVPPGMHPAETSVKHRSGASGIRALRLGDPDPEAATSCLRTLLGDVPKVTIEKADISGVLAVELDTPCGALVIR